MSSCLGPGAARGSCPSSTWPRRPSAPAVGPGSRRARSSRAQYSHADRSADGNPDPHTHPDRNTHSDSWTRVRSSQPDPLPTLRRQPTPPDAQFPRWRTPRTLSTPASLPATPDPVRRLGHGLRPLRRAERLGHPVPHDRGPSGDDKCRWKHLAGAPRGGVRRARVGCDSLAATPFPRSPRYPGCTIVLKRARRRKDAWPRRCGSPATPSDRKARPRARTRRPAVDCRLRRAAPPGGFPRAHGKINGERGAAKPPGRRTSGEGGTDREGPRPRGARACRSLCAGQTRNPGRPPPGRPSTDPG